MDGWVPYHILAPSSHDCCSYAPHAWLPHLFPVHAPTAPHACPMQGLDQLAAYAPRLTSLSLTHCWRVGAAALGALQRVLPLLQVCMRKTTACTNPPHAKNCCLMDVWTWREENVTFPLTSTPLPFSPGPFSFLFPKRDAFHIGPRPRIHTLPHPLPHHPLPSSHPLTPHTSPPLPMVQSPRPDLPNRNTAQSLPFSSLPCPPDFLLGP